MKNVIKPGMSLVLLIFLVLGCATTHAPRNWLQNPEDLQTDAFGAWITVKTVDNQELAGELIAISADSVFIAGKTLTGIAKDSIKSARLVAYKSKATGMAVFSVVMTLATPFINGLYFVFTAPMWFFGGAIAASIRSYEPVLDYPGHDWEELALFARYPQGLPPGIERNKIKKKQK